MHHYWGFGLNIASEIEFPELVACDFTEADLTIRIGKAPEALSGEVLARRMLAIANEREMLLKVPEIASYYSVDGKTIIAEPGPKNDLKSLRLFLLGTVMASILHQRKRIPFHASGFLHDEKIVLICGESGAGKSSVSASFLKEGFPHFTDDVCVIEESFDGKIWATPSYPILKLWDDSHETLQLDLNAQNQRIRDHLPKYATFLHDSFDPAPREVSHVFVLDAENNVAEPRILQLNGLDAFEAVKKNVFRIYNIHSFAQKQNLFKTITALTRNAPVYKIQRPPKGNTFAQVCGLIEEKIKRHASR